MLWVKGSGSDLATIERARLHRAAPGRDPAARRARGDERRGDGRLPRPLPARARRCRGRRSRRSCTPSSRTRTSTTPTRTRSGRSSVRPTASASPEECFGADAVWVPYIRPGFALSKLVATAVSANPDAKLVLLAKHGLVTWGATAAESYASTLEAINRAAAFVEEQRQGGAVRRRRSARRSRPRSARRLLAAVLPRAAGRARRRRAPDPPGRRLAGGARVRRRPRLGRALAGRRRLSRSSRPHQAPPRLGRLRPRARRRGGPAGAARRGRARLPAERSARTSSATAPPATACATRARGWC